jgi:multimeric flavodoxin WrbA
MASEPAQAKRLLIVWWSMTGGTRQLAEAAARGAREAVSDAAVSDAAVSNAAVSNAVPNGVSDAVSDATSGALSKAGAEPGTAAGTEGETKVEVTLLPADQAGPEDVLEASALIVATPENLASMAGMMKDFYDRCWYSVLGRIEGRPFAAIVCAGSDGQGALRQLDRFATGWRLRTVSAPLLVITHAQTPETILAPKTIEAGDLARAAELGGTMAAGLALGLW